MRPRYFAHASWAFRTSAALVLSFAAVWAAPSYAISKEFDRTYPLERGGTFELQNVNGTVEVEGWDRDAIEIHAVKTAKSKESDLDRVSIEVDAKPRSVSVVTRYPQNAGVEVAVEADGSGLPAQFKMGRAIVINEIGVQAVELARFVAVSPGVVVLPIGGAHLQVKHSAVFAARFESRLPISGQ